MVASGSRLLWSLLWFVGAASSDDAFGRKQGAAAALADAVPEADRYPRSQYPQYPRLQSLASLRPVRGKAVFLQIKSAHAWSRALAVDNRAECGGWCSCSDLLYATRFIGLRSHRWKDGA